MEDNQSQDKSSMGKANLSQTNETNTENLLEDIQCSNFDEEPPTKIRRFEMEDSNESDWDLPQSLLDYTVKYMTTRVSDKDIKEKILDDSPIPRNIRKVPLLDGYIKQLLIEHNKNSTLHIEKMLKAVQEKDMFIFGPLSKLWDMTEQERPLLSDSDESVAQFGYISNLFEKSVLLASQSYQRLTYQRRFNVLSTLIESNAKVNELLNSHSDIMNDPNNIFLFGKKFEEILSKSSASARKLSSVFTGLKSTQVGQNQASAAKPFQGGPLPRQDRGRGRFFSSFNRQSKTSYSLSFYKCCTTLKSGFPKCTQSSSVFNKGKDSFGYSCSSSIKILSKQLGDFDKGLKYFGGNSGIKDTLCVSSLSAPKLSSKLECGKSFFSGLRNRGDVAERGYKKDKSKARSVIQQSVSGFKKGWRSEASDKFKTSEFIHRISSFQDGRVLSVKGDPSEGGLYDFDRSQGCLLFSSLTQRISA